MCYKSIFLIKFEIKQKPYYKKMKKNKIFFIVFLFFLGMFFVGTNQVEAVNCTGDFEPMAGICVPSSNVTNLSNAESGDILTNFLNWLLGIFGVIAVVAFVISGIQYLTSAGDEERAKNAKRNVKYALMGIVIALSSFIIVKAVDTVLRANTTNI